MWLSVVEKSVSLYQTTKLGVSGFSGTGQLVRWIPSTELCWGSFLSHQLICITCDQACLYMWKVVSATFHKTLCQRAGHVPSDNASGLQFTPWPCLRCLRKREGLTAVLVTLAGCVQSVGCRCCLGARVCAVRDKVSSKEGEISLPILLEDLCISQYLIIYLGLSGGLFDYTCVVVADSPCEHKTVLNF